MFSFILLSEADGKTDEMIDDKRVSEYTHVISVLWSDYASFQL